MKYIDLINLVDTSDENKIEWFDLDPFCYELDIHEVNLTKAYAGLTAYWIQHWMCTDTMVGMQAIFLNNEPVALTTQVARKSDCNIHWLNKDSLERTRDFLYSCIDSRESDGRYQFIDPDETTSLYFTVDYTSQLVDYHGTYNGRKCTYINKRNVLYRPTSDHNDYCAKMILVQFEDGMLEEIDVSDFHIPLYLKAQ